MAVVTCLNCYKVYTNFWDNGPLSMPCPWCGVDAGVKVKEDDSPIQFVKDDEDRPSQ